MKQTRIICAGLIYACDRHLRDLEIIDTAVLPHPGIKVLNPLASTSLYMDSSRVLTL